MKRGLAVMCLWAALAAPAEASEPVVVLQETRTPIVSKKHRSVQHVVLLKNTSPYPVRGLRVTVEFYDFFGKLLLVRSGTPVPSSLRPGDTATLSLPTPAAIDATLDLGRGGAYTLIRPRAARVAVRCPTKRVAAVTEPRAPKGGCS